MCRLFKCWEKFFECGNLLVNKKNVRIVKYTFQRILVGNKVRRKITTIKLHTFYNVDRSFSSLCLFNCNNTILTNLVNRISDKIANSRIVVCRDCTNLCNFLLTTHRTLQLTKSLLNSSNTQVNTTLEVHRVCTGCDVLQAFTDDCLCKNSSCCCTVTCYIICLRCNLTNHLSTEIFNRVF